MDVVEQVVLGAFVVLEDVVALEVLAALVDVVGNWAQMDSYFEKSLLKLKF